MMPSNDVIAGFVWALVLLVVFLRLSYNPLNPRTNNKLVSWVNGLGESWDDKRARILLLIIFAVALLVRVWQFGHIPAGFNQDGAMAAVDAKALADYGTDRYGMKWPVQFTAWGYGQMSVLLSYLMIPFIKIAGLSEFTARLPMLLLSMAGLAALYAFIKDTLGRTSALIVLFLAAINPWHIMQSRWAIDCNAFPHFFIIGCYLLNRGQSNIRYLYLSMVSFALCMYCYGISFFTVPLFLFVVAAYTLIANIFRIKDILISIGVYVFFAWPVWLVMIVNFLRIPTIQTPIFTIAFFPDSVRSGDILFFSQRPFAQLHDNVNALLNTSILQRPDLPWNALDSYGTQYLFALPLVLLGVFAASPLFREKFIDEVGTSRPSMRKLGVIMILCGLGIGLWTGLVINSVNVNRINIIYYFLIILAGLGVTQLFRWFKPAFIFTTLLYTLSFGLFCNHYFNVWSKEIGAYFFAGMGEALHEAAKIDTPRYYVTVNSQYTGAKNVSEILTLFHHKVDAKYYQGENFSSSDDRLSADTVAGNKYQMPYQERYVYISPEQFSINTSERAVYIVTQSEMAYFSPVYFDITPMHGFALVVPKGMAIAQHH